MIDHKKRAEQLRKDPTHPEFEEYFRDPGEETTKTTCLRCNKVFNGSSKYNRICSKCKERDAWKLHPEIQFYSPN
jgi:hypothetical protein